MIKKTLIYLLILFAFLGINIQSIGADETAIIKSSYVIESEENSYLVPIEIKNNSGLMGFKVNVSYGDGVVINSISRGTVTQKGTFSDNHILNSDNNNFDVIWNYSKEITEDGEIFIIGLSVEDSFIDDVKLDISYSIPDTFNEKYEDVYIECGEIIVNEKEAETYDENSHNQVIEDAIDDNRTGIITNEIKSEDFITIVDKVIKENEFDNIDEINGDDTSIFVKKLIEEIYSKKTNEILKDLDDEEKYQIINEIYKAQIAEIDDKTTSADKITNQDITNNRFDIKIILIILVACVICVLVIIRVKGKKDEK